MRKRLRKKKRLGEFREWGREVTFRLSEGSPPEGFLDGFIEMIEAAGLSCGGGGSGQEWKLVVELGNGERAAKWDDVCRGLEARGDVFEWSAGPEFDLWHGEPISPPSM